MAKHLDQAAGLRQMMGQLQPRRCVLRALGALHDSRDQLQLANSLGSLGLSLLLVQEQNGLAPKEHTPVSLATQQRQPALTPRRQPATQPVVYPHPAGFAYACLFKNTREMQALSDDMTQRLSAIVHSMSQHYAFTLLTASSKQAWETLAPAWLSEPLIIQMERGRNAMQAAYVAIKQWLQAGGSRHIFIVVADASDAQAQQAFQHLQQVTQQFLQLPLRFLGGLPTQASLAAAGQVVQQLLQAFPQPLSPQAPHAPETLSAPWQLLEDAWLAA